jgi:hypothetical protein
VLCHLGQQKLKAIDIEGCPSGILIVWSYMMFGYVGQFICRDLVNLTHEILPSYTLCLVRVISLDALPRAYHNIVFELRT